MYESVRLPGMLPPLSDAFMGKLRIDAENAKFGHSWHQIAWDSISPYGKISNSEIDMLIFHLAQNRSHVPFRTNLAGKSGVVLDCPDHLIESYQMSDEQELNPQRTRMMEIWHEYGTDL